MPAQLARDRILRGRVLSFRDEPAGYDDTASFRYVEDGGVRIRDGRIAEVADFRALQTDGAEIVDHRPHLIVPGFIDAHAHYPQMQVIASWGAKLLDWLEKYTFPEETKFSDPEHCRRIAGHFLDTLTAHGTTTAAVYCTVHPQSAGAFFAAAEERNMAMIAGKVMMDRHAPDALCDTPQSSYDDTMALIGKWHGKGRAHYAITPRFAITSTPEQMEMAEALFRENPDCYLQTHLSENKAEIELTRELYPQARDYFDVYEKYGLLGERSLFGHAIHLSHRERDRMAETGSVAVYCPTSNLFLGSGLYDEAGLKEAGVRRAIASDVGGGTNYSMLRTLDEGYKALQLRGQNIDPLRSFYWASLGNARALRLEDRIGTLEPGTDADITVLDSRATDVMTLRMETVESLQEELFVLQTLGDDRAVAETYIAGRPAKRAPKL
ncbi:guanine deaminase [Nisaea sp.]|uniref:guanine deaminase n=1 Tax=Nisaea sp. TaxID=2024842 RepID=UPI0032663929